MAIEYTNFFHSKALHNLPKFGFLVFIPRPSTIYPNLDFWFENKSSGNPAQEQKIKGRYPSEIMFKAKS
jgi:hypothetical protein